MKYVRNLVIAILVMVSGELSIAEDLNSSIEWLFADDTDEYSFAGMKSTGQRIEIKKDPKLKGKCVDEVIRGLKRGVQDYRSGGTQMANGQFFGSFHRDLYPLKKGHKLTVRFESDPTNKERYLIHVITRETVKKNETEKPEVVVQTIIENRKKCETKQSERVEIMFDFVNLANESIKQRSGKKEPSETPKHGKPVKLQEAVK